MKVLVTGASGFLGRIIVDNLIAQHFLVYPVYRAHSFDHENAQSCDLVNRDATKDLLSRVDPNVIIHCAATSNIEECEKNKLCSWENNVSATLNLIRMMKRHVHFVYLSTAEVFDGKFGYYDVNSIRNPVHWYGYTKVISEDLITNLASIYTIVRLSYQYGYDLKGMNYVHKAIKKLMADEPVSAADDLISSPTYVKTTILAIQEIIIKRFTGIYHIADKEPLSKYQLLLKLAHSLKKTKLVTREKAHSVFLAKRPQNSSLNITKFANTFNISKPLTSKDAIARFCEDFEKRESL